MNNIADGRILLIDDMPSIHEDFRKILVPAAEPAAFAAVEGALFGQAPRERSRFKLDCASSGEEGLNLLRTAMLAGASYSLAFVDMRMPAGWDGVRTIEELWREDPQLQVVICTAYSDQPLEESLARLGSADRLLVLKKPFDPIEVTQLARALVAKRKLATDAAAYLANMEQMVSELKDASTELRKRNQELENLATTVSRELRSPLPIVSKLSTLLANELGSSRSGKVAEYLDQMREGAKGSEQLLKGVLALTEITRHDIATQSVDVSEIARDVAAQQRQANPGRQVSLSVQDGLRAWGDPRLVRLALQHLLDNAWKFTSEKDIAIITVGCSDPADGERTFFVRDSGCGFDPAKAANLFRTFQRLHPNEKFEAGAGVGLVVVSRIVERHGGRVWADSRPLQGTTIYFTLPNPLPAPTRSASSR